MARKRVVPIDEPTEFDFSASFQKFNDPEQFARFCRQYPNPEATVTYVYRLWPAIDREQVGLKDSAIAKVTGAVVDADYLLQHFGSGKYHLKFNDANRPANLQQVARTNVEIHDPTEPPIVDPRELVVNDERNAGIVSKYMQLGWTVTEQQNELKPKGFQALAPAAAATGSSGAEKVLAETVQSLALERAQANSLPSGAVVVPREVFDALLARVQGAGGDNTLEKAFEIADRLKPPAAADSATHKLLDKMADALLARASSTPVAGGAMSELRSTMQFLREEMGWSPGGAGSSDAAGFMGMFTEVLKHAAAAFGQAMAMRFMTPMPAAAPGGTPAMAGIPSGIPGLPVGGLDPSHAAPLRPAPAPGPAAAAAAHPVQGDDVNKLALMNVGMSALQAFNAGVSGDDFAEKLCDDPNTEALYDLLYNMGRDEIVKRLESVPGLAEQLAPRRAELLAWLDAFLSYNEPDSPAAA